eukprot:6247594-Amphidinium_carterae.1
MYEDMLHDGWAVAKGPRKSEPENLSSRHRDAANRPHAQAHNNSNAFGGSVENMSSMRVQPK